MNRKVAVERVLFPPFPSVQNTREKSCINETEVVIERIKFSQLLVRNRRSCLSILSQGPEELIFSLLEHQALPKTSEKMGYFDRVSLYTANQRTEGSQDRLAMYNIILFILYYSYIIILKNSLHSCLLLFCFRSHSLPSPSNVFTSNQVTWCKSPVFVLVNFFTRHFVPRSPFG